MSSPTNNVEPSSRSASTSLQAAATLNAGLQQESPQPSSGSLSGGRRDSNTSRRRSTVLMGLQLNDPSVPAPGELVAEDRGGGASLSPQPMSGSPLLPTRDPHHNRAPSLGELHQELEAEQEAQVNRLLQQIRYQQVELQRLQAAQGQPASSVAAEDPAPSSERSSSIVAPQPIPPPNTTVPRSPSISHPRSSFDLTREALHRRSRTPSRSGPSPRLRSTSIISVEAGESAVRDESAFYQAETQSLVRENQMLKHRIRELERQLSEAHLNPPLTSETSQTSLPPHPLQTTTVSEEEGKVSEPAP